MYPHFKVETRNDCLGLGDLLMVLLRCEMQRDCLLTFYDRVSDITDVFDKDNICGGAIICGCIFLRGIYTTLFFDVSFLFFLFLCVCFLTC